MSPTRLLTRLAAFSVRRPRSVLAAWIVLAAVALLLAGLRLELKTSNLDLIDADLPEVARFRAFAAEFGTPNTLIVVVEGDDRERLQAAVDRLGPRLAELTGVRSVTYRLPFAPEVVEVLGLDPYLHDDEDDPSDEAGMFFLLVQPDDPHSRAATLAPFVEGVRRTIDEAALERYGLHAGLTGLPAYALDDRDVIRRDLSVLSIVALILVLTLFATAFGAFRRPAAAVLALVLAVAVTLGMAAFIPGHLTLLSAFFASILFGLGIDFGIHVVDRVEELIAEGDTERIAVPRAIGALAPGLTTGALTTASVFYAMRFSGFLGFAELGTIAGTGILLCLLATVTALPALLVLIPSRKSSPRRRDEGQPPERRLGRALVTLGRTRLAWVVVALALAVGLFGGPGFDADYLNLQPQGSEAVRLERDMVRRSSFSPQFAVFVAADRERVKELVWELVNDETVASVRSIRDLEIGGFAGVHPEVPDAFLSSLMSPAGHFAVYAYPKGDIWNPVEQERFLAHMRALDAEVTGMPFLGQFMVERSRRALAVTAFLGGILLTIFVLSSFRRVVPGLLAILPTVLTMLSLNGLMHLLDLPWNPLSIMALPVILGIAVDDGVHVVHRFLAEGGDLDRTLAGTGRSVVLTSLTTLSSFGAVAFTTHRGLGSFALTTVLGVGMALVLSVVVLPRLLEISERFARSEPSAPPLRQGTSPCSSL